MLSIAPSIFLMACSQSHEKNKNIEDSTIKKEMIVKAVSVEKSIQQKVEEDTLGNFADYYVAVLDTNMNYNPIHSKMFSTSEALNIPIDTLGRYYNKKKDEIILPENDEDEIYAGEYFPRRNAEENLSLEYLNMYKPDAKAKTIALVAGIYADKDSATIALKKLKTIEPKAFVLKSKIYVGCMH
ncbi:hypothetical protein [Pedobacter roseus]|uniref:SPOR domain-containing protein n=1 Tax=Pedobacter roseus TaxID=336820 RepID=A0A7G9QBZ4_9SPHI|nr:hypothetical protein [Pedobacter roseus]QNN40869.1 hypothetical protein H9L23_17275 [Pedobacter roseus]